MAKADDWRKRVAAWKRSGLTAREFAARNNLSAQQLHNWSWRLGGSIDRKQATKRAANAVRLLRVIPQKKIHAAPTIRLRIGKATVEVDAQFDEVLLRRVAGVLSSVAGDTL